MRIEFSEKIKQIKRKEVIDLIEKHKIIEKYYELKEIFDRILKESNNISEFYQNIEGQEYQVKKSELRQVLQYLLNYLCDSERLWHIPVYISDKFKILKKGVLWHSAIKTSLQTGYHHRYSIVIFIIQMTHYDIENVKNVLYMQGLLEIFETLLHEFTHYYLAKQGKGLGHSANFYDTFDIFWEKYIDYQKISDKIKNMII
ncbi:MAG: hypothetical protein QXT38_04125 [Candidatus Aenigmatarchaeota archaeon]